MLNIAIQSFIIAMDFSCSSKDGYFVKQVLSQYSVVCASYAEGALTCMSVSLKVIPPRRVPEPPLLNTPMQKAFDSLVCMNR